jgi:hypothetical protein
MKVMANLKKAKILQSGLGILDAQERESIKKLANTLLSVQDSGKNQSKKVKKGKTGAKIGKK